MVGARTIASIALLGPAIAVLAWLGVLHPDRLRGLDATAVFWSTCFAIVAGTLIFRFFRLRERSAYYFRYAYDEYEWQDEASFFGTARHRVVIGVNQGDAFDFTPGLQFGIYVALTFWVGVAAFDRRAINLVADFPRKFASTGVHMCPDPGEKQKREPHEEPGCALLRRAYALGYAKSLGQCEQKEEETVEQICTLRQRDEPLLHYAWRLFAKTYAGVESSANTEYFREIREEFETKLDHLEPLYDSKRVVIGTQPRASHHIWTNLPNPEDRLSDATYGFLGSGRCLDRYRRLPNRPRLGEDKQINASRVFDHVLGQLLFDPRYAPAAGHCREYTVHWGAAADVCAQIVGRPEAILAETEALAPVRMVLSRYALRAELGALTGSTAAAQSDFAAAAAEPSAASIPPQRFVSLQCYIEEERTDVQRSELQLALDGHTFQIDEIRVPSDPPTGQVPIHRYGQIARLLVKGFHYGNLLSRASPGLGLEDETSRALFAGGDGYFAKLGFLADMDIFVGHDWILQREDLLAVYPHHSHLGNFVDVFRRRYRRERGRL